MAADELIIKIGAETSKFRSELDKVKKQTADLEKGLATTAKISAAAFVGLATAAGLAVKSFAKFEDGFSDVVTLLDKSAFGAKKFEQGISEMKSGILDLGAATGESFDVLNKALFDTVSAGVDAGDSLEFLAAATDLAVAGATDTSVAVDGMTSAMNAFGLDASEATSIAQKFFVAQKGGKALCLETPILTPDRGFIKNGDLKTGDLVFNENGGVEKIIKAHDVIKGAISYKLTFDDKTSIDACEDHNWFTYTARDRRSIINKRIGKSKREPAPQVRTTKEVLETLLPEKDSFKYNHYIQLPKPLNLKEKKQIIDPYLLGLWLGDGATDSSRFSTIDKELIDSFSNGGYLVKKVKGDNCDYDICNIEGKNSKAGKSLWRELRESNLLGNKHIPDNYLFGSIEQRLALLQGLMDSDGFIDLEKRVCEFSSTIYGIAENVKYLVDSLGMRAKIAKKKTKQKESYKDAYRVTFTPNKFNPFRLKRKSDRLKSEYKKSDFIAITNVEKIENKDMRCLTVTGDKSLYLAGKSLIVTHNTTVEEMAEGFGKAGATANAYGVSLDELLGAVSAVTLGGVKTSAAYTGFNAVLAGIAKPTADATAEAKRLGIQFDTTALRTQGLTGFLDTLRTANGFTQQSVEKLFGSVEAQKVAFALTGSQADAYASQIKALGDKQKLAADFAGALAVKNETVSKSMAKLSRSAESIAITIGERLAPDVIKLSAALTEIVKKFNDLSEEQKDSIVFMGKIAAGFAAFVAVASTSLLVLVKLRNLWKGVGIAISKIGPALGKIGTRIAGISVSFLELGTFAKTALGGLARGLSSVLGLLTLSGDTIKDNFKASEGSVEQLQQRLGTLEKQLKTIQNLDIQETEEQKEYRVGLEQEIGLYKKLIVEKQTAANIGSGDLQSDFGTGQQLIRPVVDSNANPADEITNSILGGQDSIKIPFSLEFADGGIEADEKLIEAEEKLQGILKKSEAKKTQIIKDEAANRIEKARRENANLLEINEAKNQGLSEQELGFIRKTQDLDNETREAKKIKDDEERSLELENIDIQNDELLNQITMFNELKAEEDVLKKEGQLERQEEFLALTKANEDLEDIEKRIRISNFNLAATEAQKKQNKTDLEMAKTNATRKKQLQGQIESQLVDSAFTVANELIKISGESAKKQFLIQKSLGIIQVLINGYMAKHLTEATVPGPAGIALGEYQLNRAFISAATIAATSAIQYSAMAQGGLVQARGGLRDNVPALLEQGELIVPKAVAPDFIQAVGRPDISAEETSGGVQQIEIGFTENAFEIIERKQNEDIALGIREA